MKKLLALLALLLALTACSSTDPEPTETPSTEGDGTTVTENAPLVVYTNSGTDGRGDWLIAKAAEAGFEIEVVSLGAAEMTNRIVMEKNAQIADVVWGLNAVEYEKIKKENLLVQFEPSWGSDIDIAYGDPEGYYWPIVVQPLGFAYNPAFVTDLQVTDIEELATTVPGQYQIHPLTGGTASTTLSSILVRYADPEGELGVSEEGWAVAEAYVKNGYMTSDGEEYWENVVNGEMPYVNMWGSGILLNETNYETDFEFIYPEIGMPFVVEQLAIFDTENVETSKRFVDWMGGAELQAEFSNEFGTTPAHPEALLAAPANVQELMAKCKPQTIDWALVAEYKDAWVEKASLEFLD